MDSDLASAIWNKYRHPALHELPYDFPGHKSARAQAAMKRVESDVKFYTCGRSMELDVSLIERCIEQIY